MCIRDRIHAAQGRKAVCVQAVLGLEIRLEGAVAPAHGVHGAHKVFALHARCHLRHGSGRLGRQLFAKLGAEGLARGGVAHICLLEIEQQRLVRGDVYKRQDDQGLLLFHG